MAAGLRGSQTRESGTRIPVWIHDAVIMTMAGVLAGCGLVYEYLLAHVAGRVLGAVETVIFTMIGIMIVAMGVGSFLARSVRHPFAGFAWLEGGLALTGGASVLLLGAITAVAIILPQTLAATYGLPPDLIPRGGLVASFERVAAFAPYLLGAIIGVMVGMEIPLLARIRQEFHARHLVHNTGTIYGADYIGAGLGAAAWVAFMLAMEPSRAAVLTAAVNLCVGVLFLVLYGRWLRRVWVIVAMHGLVGAVLVTAAIHGTDWARAMEDLLYRDKVVYSIATEHQRLTVTQRVNHPGRPPVYTFFINGRTQFGSDDEHIYHAMLTYPPLAAAARRDHILVIGGGDGLAVRDILRWNPREVVVLDLDSKLVDFFSKPLMGDGRIVNSALLELNEFAFRDPRVKTVFGDAFLRIDELLHAGRRFDAIVIDLPDPSHPDLNRLYTRRFYEKLRLVLAGDGAMAVQSTSPYHARRAFLSIGKTVQAAGFAHVEQYHQNVPSFGEWGWTVAVPLGAPASARIRALPRLPVDDGWTTREVMLGAFAFPRDFRAGLDAIDINRVGTAAIYRYYQKDWEFEQGLHPPKKFGSRP